MEALFLRVLTLSLTSTAVLLPLLVLLPRLRTRYAGRTCYTLWLLLTLRLLLPVQFTLPKPPVTVEAPAYEVSLPARPWTGQAASSTVQIPTAPALPVPPEQKSGQPKTEQTVSLTALLAALWLCIGAGRLLWTAGVYLAARRRLLRSARPADEGTLVLLAQLQGALGLRAGVTLRRSYLVRSPMLLGLWRPTILLPGEGMPAGELELVLRHELTHQKRGDVAYKALLLLCTAVHWFNPAVWLMAREAGRNLELCCDDDVTRAWDAAGRRRYGEVLLKTAAWDPAPALSTRFGGGKRQLKGRLTNLFSQKRNSKILVCAVLALALLAGSLVACEGKKGLTAQEAMDALEESITLLEADGEETGFPPLGFQIPQDYPHPEQWNLHISGRAVPTVMGGTSLRYLEGETWEAGNWYSLPITIEQWRVITELTLTATLPGEDGAELEREIDLLQAYQMLMEPDIAFSIMRSDDSALPVWRSNGYQCSLSLSEPWGGLDPVDWKIETDSDNGLVLDWTDGTRRIPIAVLCLRTDAEPDGNVAGDERLMAYLPEKRLAAVLQFAPVPGELTGAELARWQAFSDNLRGLPDTSFALLPQEEEDPVYRSERFPFTLALPDSWVGHYTAEEDENGVRFYMSPKTKSVGKALLCEISVQDEATHGYQFIGREELLGTREGLMYLLLSPQSPFLTDDDPTVADTYDQLYSDISYSSYHFSFTDGLGLGGDIWAAAMEVARRQVPQRPRTFDPVTGKESATAAYTYVDSRLDSLSFSGAANGYTVYAMEYRLLVDHPEQVTPVGGQEIDENGWLRPYSMTCYLILKNGGAMGAYYSDLDPSSPMFWHELETWTRGEGEALTDDQWKTVAMAAYCVWEYSVLSPALCVKSDAGLMTKTATELGQGEYPQRYVTSQEQVEFVRVDGLAPPARYANLPTSLPDSNNRLLGDLYYILSDSLAKSAFKELVQQPDAPLHCFDGQFYIRADTQLLQAPQWDTFQLETVKILDGEDVDLRLEFTLDDKPYTLERGDSGHGYAWRFTRFAGAS